MALEISNASPHSILSSIIKEVSQGNFEKETNGNATKATYSGLCMFVRTFLSNFPQVLVDKDLVGMHMSRECPPYGHQWTRKTDH